MKNEIIRELGGYVARHRHARISSRKARLVADAILGRPIPDDAGPFDPARFGA